MPVPYESRERPPFVRFEPREFGRNVEASELAGRPIPRIVTMACITPHGSKDCIEKPADEWIAEIRKKAAEGMYNPEHAQMFVRQYDMWKQGEELPREGTPVKTWQGVTKEQATRLHAIGYTTVEDLAQVPDSGLGIIGLDGRALRDLARAWVKEGKEVGTIAQENAKLLSQIEDMKKQNDEQRDLMNKMADRLEALEAAGATVPRKGNKAA